MNNYAITFKSSVEKDLKKLPDDIINIIFDKIDILKSNPFPIGYKKLIGTKHLYRIRVGDYRIIYEVDKIRFEIVIFYIRHRKDIYKSNK